MTRGIIMTKNENPLPRCLKFMDNLAKNSVKGYNHSIKKYEAFTGMCIEDLVNEALDEQSQRVPTHQLKIIERLEDFQSHLVDEGLVYSTIKICMIHIKAIYHKNRVDIPYIETLNPKQIKRREYLEYKHILTEDELKRALQHMRLPSQARLMAMVQGGLSNEECEQLMTDTFLDETFKYHKKDNPIDALKWLADENNPIIWVTKLFRKKTMKPYYVLLGSEAVNKIAEAKLYELELPSNKGELSNKLLNINKKAFNRSCQNVNAKLGLGYVTAVKYKETTDEKGNIYIKKSLFQHFVMKSEIDYDVHEDNDVVTISTDYPNAEIEYEMGGECKLSPHKLRKYHATHIKGSVLSYEENSLISNADIDEMQGRGKTSVQDTYIKSNPIKQKLLYAKVMNNVSLFHKYEYKLNDVRDDVVVSLKDIGLENKELHSEIEKLKTKLHEKERQSNEVKELREKWGDDKIIEVIEGMLNPTPMSY